MMKNLIYLLVLVGMNKALAQVDSAQSREPKLLAARLGTGLLGYKAIEPNSYFNLVSYYFHGHATFNSKHLLKSGVLLQFRNSFDISLFTKHTPDPSFGAFYTLGLNKSNHWIELYSNLGMGVHFGKVRDVKSFVVSPEAAIDAGFTLKPFPKFGVGLQAQATFNPYFYTTSFGMHVSYSITYKTKGSDFKRSKDSGRMESYLSSTLGIRK